MRRISAWVALVAADTVVIGIYGMNFDKLPELHTRYDYFVCIVGDQVIPQAADQERPLGDDVRRADGTTFAVHYRLLDVRWMLRPAGSYKQVLPRRPPATLPSTSTVATPVLTRDQRTCGGCPATTELTHSLGRGQPSEGHRGRRRGRGSPTVVPG
jgi:CorA-like Mg2+ transporter protein